MMEIKIKKLQMTRLTDITDYTLDTWDLSMRSTMWKPHSYYCTLQVHS